MSDSKQYEIKRLADLSSVPADKIDACLVDLKSWVGYLRELKEVADIVNADELFKASVESVGFTWIDDGKHDAHITVKTVIKAKGGKQ